MKRTVKSVVTITAHTITPLPHTRSHNRLCSWPSVVIYDGSTFVGLQMLKGGVIMDVITAEQAKIAEDAGAAAVMALERVPADIRKDGGVARMSDPRVITGSRRP